ncbi:MAG TPA: AsmA-like C-terminal region-containing protein [Opitutaceae bacterium]|nr:AsmA-like C-terminal region-containing protein [Opitutaceae bacterium]
MKGLSSTWLVFRWCASCIGHFLLWTVWLALIALLILQIVIASSHELRVPNRLIQSFRDRLAVAGLRVDFDSASFDTAGSVVLENLRVFSEQFDEPLSTCKALYVRIDPVSLLIGNVEPTEVEAQNVTLFVPPIFSPTGRAEPFLENIDCDARLVDRRWNIRQLTGHAGALAVSLSGEIRGAKAQGRPAKPGATPLGNVLRDYLQFARQLAFWQSELTAFESPSLHVTLRADEHDNPRAELLFFASAARVPSEKLKLPKTLGNIEVAGLRVQSNVPIAAAPASAPLDVRLDVDSVELGDGSNARHLHARGLLRLGSAVSAPKVASLDFSADKISSRGHTVTNLSIQANPENWPAFSGRVTARLLDQNWSADGYGNLKNQSAQLSLLGAVSPAMMKYAGDQLKQPLDEFVAIETPSPVSANLELTPGWKLGAVDGKIGFGKVDAHRVLFDRGVAAFHLRGTRLLVDDISVTAGPNWARGSYEMDTGTLNYRFLLVGALRPAHIGGFFHDWWTNFWDHFDFSAAPPVADIDIQGKWGAPEVTKIFVQADCDHPAIQSVKFDRVATSFFIRPEFYDAVDLVATRGDRKARGTFTRSVDLDQGDFRWMTFNVRTDLDLQESAKIFGSAGVNTVDPFRFQNYALLDIDGRLDGPASVKGEHENVKVVIDSKGGFRFFDFPLSDLRCTALIQDRVITLPDIDVGFAGGRATGTAQVTGEGDARKVSFTADLKSASLGESIRILEAYGASLRHENPAPVSAFQQRVATGKLDINAAAEGLYKDMRSFVGSGSADLRGAELAQINLLGSLSAALRGNSMLGFTSWDLDTVHTRFNMLEGRIDFPDLVATGPTAKLDAHGSYFLGPKTINFHAKFYPFDRGKTLLANAVDLVLTPLSAVLELKLTGDLADPKWFFEYGPTNLFRKISGAPKPGAPTEEEPLELENKDLPPPFLRR